MSLSNLLSQNNYDLHCLEIENQSNSLVVPSTIALGGALAGAGVNGNLLYTKQGKNITIAFEQAIGAHQSNAFITGTILADYRPSSDYFKRIIVVHNNASSEGVVEVKASGALEIKLNISDPFTTGQIGYRGFSVSYTTA
jgi:hypothetical protein